MTFKEIGTELPPIFEFKEKGDSITGIYKGKRDNIGKHKSHMYTFEVDGELKSIWGSTVIDNKMIDPEIQEGKTIKITFIDESKGYKNFRIEVDDDEADEPESESKEE